MLAGMVSISFLSITLANYKKILSLIILYVGSYLLLAVFTLKMPALLPLFFIKIMKKQK